MHHRSFCTPKPDADLCMRVDLKTRQKNCGKSGLLLGRGPLGRLGPRAVGRWAAGLLLAKPVKRAWCQTCMVSNVHGVKRAWCQSCMVSKLHGVKLAWCQTCMVSNVHVAKLAWCQTCLVSNLPGVQLAWCQTCMVSKLHVVKLAWFQTCMVSNLTRELNSIFEFKFRP